MIRVLALIIALFSSAAQAEEIVLGLSQDEVAISATFDGSEILIFGAISRNAPVAQGELGIIITVSGPLEPITVRMKDRRVGIWVNTSAAEIESAPSFYAVASSGPLDEILTEEEDQRLEITLPKLIHSADSGMANIEDFTDALIRIRAGQHLYQVLEGSVDFEQETLFRTSIELPANLIEGEYPTRIFLTRDGVVADSYDTLIVVQKVGIERWLFRLAHDNPVLYGLLSLSIAIAAGWLASAAFTGFRR